MLRVLFSERGVVNETRLLWIDAICINQQDVQERNHQVRIMSHIYKWAECVRVWLGGPTNKDGEAFKLMEKILYGPQHLGYTIDDLFNPFSDRWVYSDKEVESEWENVHTTVELSNSGGWEALASIFERSYWSRIWIVQEYLLARDVVIHVGKLRITDEYLKTSLENIDRLPPPLRARLPAFITQSVERIISSVGKEINDMRRDKHCLSLLELMETTRDAHCQVAHDRIYAILGLAKDIATFKSIPIDYNRSPFKVKMDIAWAVQQRPGCKYNDVYLSRIIKLVCEAFSEVPDESD
jgi:hypothetical protein